MVQLESSAQHDGVEPAASVWRDVPLAIVKLSQQGEARYRCRQLWVLVLIDGRHHAGCRRMWVLDDLEGDQTCAAREEDGFFVEVLELAGDERYSVDARRRFDELMRQLAEDPVVALRQRIAAPLAAGVFVVENLAKLRHHLDESGHVVEAIDQVEGVAMDGE